MAYRRRLCAICGQHNVDHFVLRDDVWMAAMLQPTDVAHFACVDKRVPILASDLMDIRQNDALKYALRKGGFT